MSQVNNSKSSLNTSNTKTIHFLKPANSHVLNVDFKKGQIVALPTNIANYFLANKIAEKITEGNDKIKNSTIEKKEKAEKKETSRYFQHPLIRNIFLKNYFIL